MKLSIKFLLMFCAMPASQLYGQDTCNRNKIVGEWVMISNYVGNHTNIDSMRQVVQQSPDSSSIYHFHSDGIFTKKLFEGKKRRSTPKNTYSFNSNTCTLMFYQEKKSGTQQALFSNYKVIYVDDYLMVWTSSDNPKGAPYTYMLRKK